MKRYFVAFLLVSLSAMTVSCGQSPKKDIALKKDTKDLKALENYVETLEKEGMYGGFLLMENDQVLFQKSMGYANKERNIKSNPNTVYLYGSIVKDYTMALIFLLESEGKLNTNDKISNYFKNVPDDKKDITIGQVVKHTSGLINYHDLADPAVKKKYKDLGYPNDLFPMTREESLKAIFSEKLLFKPGTKEEYSNAGYSLLSYLAENVTNKPFDQLIQEYILIPAKTKKADFYSSPLWTPDDVAVGYSKFTYGKENSPVYWPRNPGAITGAGGLAGSLMDLYLGTKYLISLEETNPTFKKLAEKYKYIPQIPSNYHGSAGGGMLGFVAVNFVIKDKKQYLLYASNNNTDGEDENMLRKVMKLGFGFDIASLVPGEFADDTKGDEEVNITADGKEKNKWGLPNKLKYDRIGAFLDLLASKTDLKTFQEENCGESFSKKLPKLYKKWPKSEHIKYSEIRSLGTTMDITIKDTITNKKYTFAIKLEKTVQAKFKSIKLK